MYQYNGMIKEYVIIARRTAKIIANRSFPHLDFGIMLIILLGSTVRNDLLASVARSAAPDNKVDYFAGRSWPQSISQRNNLFAFSFLHPEIEYLCLNFARWLPRKCYYDTVGASVQHNRSRKPSFLGLRPCRCHTQAHSQYRLESQHAYSGCQ
jgi:hypothetical protein